MVEIVCRAPKQLVVLECTQYPSAEALTKTYATVIMTGESVILKWTEGVLFSYSLLTLMPEYRSTVRVGTVDIPVIDVTPNPLSREAAQWMKASAQSR